MDNNIKSRFYTKDGSSGNKIKTEMPDNSKISMGLLDSDGTSKTYLSKCIKDQQIRLKLLELTPRNPAKNASEGVQEFLKQVSNYIEKKNPFKDKPGHGRIKKTVGAIDSYKFNMKNEDFQNNPEFYSLGRTTFDRINDISSDNVRKFSEKLKWEDRNSAVSFKKIPERVLQGKKNRSGISVRKKDENVKRNQKELPWKNKKNAEMKRVITLSENPVFLYENERRNRVTHVSDKKTVETSTNKKSQTKKKKLSEIPLRKNRKPVSTLSHKPLEDVESNFSIDLFPKRKTFSPIEELSLCSEIQVIISAAGSSENLSESGKTSDSELNKNTISGKCSFGRIELNKYFNNSDVASYSKPSSAKLSEDFSSTEKKVKVLDLEKVKTSSFTVLRSNTGVLDRLESLHKQNISTKDKIAANTMSRLKILTPKNSFCSLKGKSLKKNLSLRLSSKRNKPSLKIKGRKSKKEMEGTSQLEKKPFETKKKTDLDVCCEILAGFESDNYKGSQNKERTDRKSDNIPITVRKTESKSIPRRIATQKEKEEPKTHLVSPPISPKTNTEDLMKCDKVEPMKNKKLEKAGHRSGKPDEKENKLVFKLMFPNTPRTPPTPSDIGHSMSETHGFENIQKEDDDFSSKTIILDNKFNEDKNSSWGSNEAETRKKPTKTKSNIEKTEYKSKESIETTKMKKLNLVIKGRPLNFKKDEPPEKPESSDSRKIKTQLILDLNSQSEIKILEDKNKKSEELEWRFMNNKKCNGELISQTMIWKDLANEEIMESNFQHICNIDKSIASELIDETVGNKSFDSVFLKPCSCCSSLKGRNQCKTTSMSVKGARKKKNEINTKLKGGPMEENENDLFEDVASIKLRRRNSEPHTFKEFVWKRADLGNYKGVRPSVSSLSSSLRHLNTDDIDDFIFWEPIPQKMTSCWEMSLYNFKKPWTVLSCSVFKDNRQSKTPGLILQNLKRGGNSSPRPTPISRNEKTICHKENPFDVEPSIAQKNIDIRNWLAALNFPITPSTSNDVIGEGRFSIQATTNVPNINKTEACPKRRKVLPNIKFSDEKVIEGKKKYKTSTNWEANEMGHLMELIRRKSGGFVTKEQFLNSNPSIPSQNPAVNFCTYSKSAEEELEKPDNGNVIIPEPATVESLEASPSSSVSETKSVRRNQSVGTDEIKYEISEPQTRMKLFGERCLTLKLKPFASEAKVWKFLFIFTLFVALFHYYFVRSSVYKINSSDN